MSEDTESKLNEITALREGPIYNHMSPRNRFPGLSRAYRGSNLNQGGFLHHTVDKKRAKGLNICMSKKHFDELTATLS
ncbi:hypothetical protein AYI69_g2206 [Smittium culicis]|uniref:Uncharacterized protein n=1 Tax=Smittium culicis TaxID=133412 RepID=A0A1R1YNC0_9FUNG|nr:hypothetical protein AYI69_g2206 [Smittium culicis]